MYQYRSNSEYVLVCGRVRRRGYENRVLAFSYGCVRDLENKAARQNQARFHVDHGDYFATLATVFHIAAKEKDIDMTKIFEKLAEDLRYLQENYEIKKK